jgi:hypothetical protein
MYLSFSKDILKEHNLLTTLILATVSLWSFKQSEENRTNAIGKIDIDKFW